MKIIRPTIICFLLLSLITGIAYPLAITLIANVGFRHQAEGSLIDKNGRPTVDESAAVGSFLIGQTFDQPQYFWSRPSATSPMPYNAAASSGSNIGPSILGDTVKSRVDALHQADPANSSPIPIDLVTASGSGLDPHESVAAADYQISRISRIRRMDAEQLHALIARHTQDRAFGLFGEKVVNVLELNLELDQVASIAAASQPAATTK